MKKSTALSFVALLALVGAPRAWGQAFCTGCTTTEANGRAIYTFLGSGSFTPTVGMTGVNILVVAGGGGGGGAQGSSSGKYNYGGGGGAGGFLAPTGVTLTANTPYTVTVGGGGAGGSYAAKGGSGANSVFGTPTAITAIGGGGAGSGGSAGGTVDLTPGLTGGSGGGGGWMYQGGYYYVGAAGGNTSGQGNVGAAANNAYPGYYGGGGGGAGAAGSVQTGGSGAANSITGASVIYAGGGGAAAYPTGGAGGSGVGGAGAGSAAGNGAAGAANRGGGGGGGANSGVNGNYYGGAGGSGIVIVSYPISPTAVTLISAKATEQDGGVLLEWRTGYEVSNLGFHIYREDNGQRVRLTYSSPVAGSALLAGANTRLTAGYSYNWWDPDGAPWSVYFLEDVDISGERKMSDPVNVRRGAGLPATASRKRMPAASSRLLNEVGRAGADRAEFFRIAPADQPLEAMAAGVTAAAAARATAQNLQKQYALAAGAAVKLGVQSEGWYRVTQSQLAAAGLAPTANPLDLQLFANGVEQPILVEGQAGGTFTAIDFYGLGLDTIWSDTQVYWLVAGSGPGLRIQSQYPPKGQAGAASFPFTIEWEPRTVYAAEVLTTNGDGNEFFGPIVTTTPVSQNLTVTHLAAGGGSSRLRVTLQGATAGPHSVAVSLNGYPLGNVTFSDLTEGVATFPVPALVEGANTLTLTAQGGASDVSGVDNVQLTYPHSYIADSNSLRMTAASGQKVTVSGFTGSSVQVIDITNPGSASLAPDSVTAGAVTFVAQGGGTRTLLAVASSQFASPASITANNPSSWHSAQPGADMVIVSHASLLGAVAPLATLRQSQGHTVKAIDVEDLYDEFNFGSESPYAIRSFLSTAKANWTTKPAYVLLMGNGTFDPRNYLGTTAPDLMPAKLVDTSLLETASDDWFADFNNDAIPEMAIGRIPAETVADATIVVNRLIAYDQSGSGGWKNQALLVAGQDQSGDNFEGFTATVAALLPVSVTATQILAGSDVNAHSDLLAQLDAGQALVNYVGHGSDDVWLGLLDDADATALTNGASRAWPLVLSMTCLNGYFQDVYTTALAKALLNAPNGGAVAVWASSGLTDASPQSNINQAMVKALYGAQPMTIGQAAAAAKKATTDLDVRRTWILFGDPAMKLQ